MVFRMHNFRFSYACADCSVHTITRNLQNQQIEFYKMPWLVSCSENSVEVLRSLLGFGQQSLADVVFVAIDFEGTSHIGKAFQISTNSQLGISVFDARDLLLELQELEPSILHLDSKFLCRCS
jgi:hypothetical protein